MTISKQQIKVFSSEAGSELSPLSKQIWTGLLWSLLINVIASVPAYSQNGSSSINGYSQSAAGVQTQTPWDIRNNFLNEHKDVRDYAQAQQQAASLSGGGGTTGASGGDGGMASSSGAGVGGVKDGPSSPIIMNFSRIFPSPVPVPSTVTIPTTVLSKPFFQAVQKKVQVSQPEGPLTASQSLANSMAVEETASDFGADPDRFTKPALAAASAMSTSAANSMAGAAVSQATGAIEFTRHYLVNFTAQSGSSWQSLRNNIFIPIAILLLLPGAVLAQVRAIVAQGSPILGEVNPFEGITRSIIAIFMIPASFLVVNYGIDVANSLTFSISTEYWNLFGTDMYQDAECAEMRAFPVNGQNQNLNAFLPIPFSLPPIMKDPWSMFESTGVANKLFDPCAGLNISNVADEQSSSSMSTNRMMMNGSNAFLAMTWNIMCAFQTVFLYYLWCMGPIVAALWVWPMEKLRSALPGWIEGVITLCFWSLFWNTVVLLMACFRGVSETGTVIMTALNGLATISVWYAFDFSALISEGAGYSMMNAISSAMKSGGGGGGGGAQQKGGGLNQTSNMGRGMGGPNWMPGGGGTTTAAMGGSAGGAMGSGANLAMAPGAMSGLGPIRGAGIGASGLAPSGGNIAGGVPGTGMPMITSASSGGINTSRANVASLNSAVNSEFNSRGLSNMTQQQTQQAQATAAQMQKVAQQEAQQRAQQQGQTQQEQALKQQMLLADYARGHGTNMSALFGQNNPQAQAAQEAMKGTTVGQFVSQSSAAEQQRLAALMNANSSRSSVDLPPSTLRPDAMLAATGGLGVPVTGSPDFGSPTLNSLGVPDGVNPNTLVSTAATFSAGSLAGPPPVETSTTYSTVPGGVNTSEIYVPASTDASMVSNSQGSPEPYPVAPADMAFRTDQSLSVDWSAASTNNMARGSGVDPSANVQAAYMPYAQSPPPQTTEYITQTNQPAYEQNVQYMPMEVKQEKVEVQQVQQDRQEVIVYQQPPRPAETKPIVQKRVENINPVFASPPVVPKSNASISSVLAGLQPGIKPNENKSAGQPTGKPDENKLGGQPGIKPNESQLGRESNSGIPTDEQAKELPRTEGSLAEHFSRLQRGGGRTAPTSKDILKESDLPPKVKEPDESEEKDS